MVYRTVYPWYRYDSLYSVIFSLSNIDCILTRTRVWGFALNSIPYGISIGADTVHSALFHTSSRRSSVSNSISMPLAPSVSFRWDSNLAWAMVWAGSPYPASNGEHPMEEWNVVFMANWNAGIACVFKEEYSLYLITCVSYFQQFDLHAHKSHSLWDYGLLSLFVGC